MSVRLAIVGGSDAGIEAARRVREIDAGTEVTVLVGDAYPNYSICGLPYYVAGDVPDWRSLAHRSRAELEATGMRLWLEHRATGLDAEAKELRVRRPDGSADTLNYDRLILATGAVPVRPPLDGLDLDGVHLLHTMDDAFVLNRAAGDARSAVIVGAGYIGLECAEALTQRGLKVTVVERLPEVLPTVDTPLGALVRDELVRHGVDVRTATTVLAISDENGHLRVHGEPSLDVLADLVLLSVGVQPDVSIAVDAGAGLGARGAIAVDATMATSLPDVWAAGDCAETYHALTGTSSYLPLGTTAHKQGRIAGENALGAGRHFAGSLGTQVVKVFDLAAARTGLRDDEARAAGFDPLTVAATAPDHKPYYPGAHDIAMRWTADRTSGRLLGCQLVGHQSTQIAKRIDVPATAMHAGWTIDRISDLDLSYTPPFGSPWDALQVGAQAWTRANGVVTRPRP
jgi:NADPH-dependent 2,4-dienoyl-CoA reductase/sulfur reductase-like enzyme